jgi:hypothetical protein
LVRSAVNSSVNAGVREGFLKMSFKMDDRLTQGFLAGAAGWPPQIVFTATMFKLHFTKLRYLDFAAILTFNHKPQGIWEVIFAEIVVIIFLGVLGIGFSMLLKVVSSENLFFKGWLYGTFTWFAIYAAMTMYKLEHIYPVDTRTALVSLIAAAIWSIGMTRVLLYLNRKYGVKN